MQDKKCSLCTFCQKTPLPGQGDSTTSTNQGYSVPVVLECRYHPPQGSMGWPTVKEDDWCGKFMPLLLSSPVSQYKAEIESIKSQIESHYQLKIAVLTDLIANAINESNDPVVAANLTAGMSNYKIFFQQE